MLTYEQALAETAEQRIEIKYLRAINAELLDALEKVSTYFEPTCNVGKAIRAAIAKAKEAI